MRSTAPTLLNWVESFRGKELVTDVRGHGFLAAITLPRRDRRDEGAVGAALMASAQRHGLLVRAIGDTVAFAPPLIATAAEIEEMASRFDAAYADVLAAGLRCERPGNAITVDRTANEPPCTALQNQCKWIR